MDAALATATKLLSDTNAELAVHQAAVVAADEKIKTAEAALAVFLAYDANADKKVLTDKVTELEAEQVKAAATLAATKADLKFANEQVTKNNLKVSDNSAYLALAADA